MADGFLPSAGSTAGVGVLPCQLCLCRDGRPLPPGWAAARPCPIVLLWEIFSFGNGSRRRVSCVPSGWAMLREETGPPLRPQPAAPIPTAGSSAPTTTEASRVFVLTSTRL